LGFLSCWYLLFFPLVSLVSLVVAFVCRQYRCYYSTGSCFCLLLLMGKLCRLVVCYSEKNGGLFEHLKHRGEKKQQPSSCKKLRQYAKRKKKEIAFYIHTFPRSAACAVFLFYRFNILSSSSSSSSRFSLSSLFLLRPFLLMWWRWCSRAFVALFVL